MSAVAAVLPAAVLLGIVAASAAPPNPVSAPANAALCAICPCAEDARANADVPGITAGGDAGVTDDADAPARDVMAPEASVVNPQPSAPVYPYPVLDRSISVVGKAKGCVKPSKSVGEFNQCVLEGVEKKASVLEKKGIPLRHVTGKTSHLAETIEQLAASKAPILLVTDGVQNSDNPSCKAKNVDVYCRKQQRRLLDVLTAKGRPPIRVMCLAFGDALSECCRKMSVCDDTSWCKEGCSVVHLRMSAAAQAFAALESMADEWAISVEQNFQLVAKPATAQPAVARLLGETFADAVLIGRKDDWHCSGVVVGGRYVLTARHCLPATRILIGDDARLPGLVFEVAATFVHPESNVDVALLRTTAELPVAIKSRRRVTESSEPSGTLRFAGFGAADPFGTSGMGRKKLIEIAAAGWGCSAFRAATTGCVPATEMVAGGPGSGDTCAGDSGGPLYEMWGDGKTCGWRLVAITSRRVADATATCGSGGIYTRVDTLDGWLSTVLNMKDGSL